MTKKAVLYARVSAPDKQDTDDKVSLDQQIITQRELCERNGWKIIGEFVDNEYYKATQSPKRGRIVNPSGERADRPQFLAMLEVVKAGDADAVLCWRDDRLVRHPRVAVALEDALDIGDVARNSKGKIKIHDATGAVIDRFTLSIKATIWREENKRRAERVRMGKIATLQQGYWPGSYDRLGYKTRKGPRGRIIEIEESEVEIVRTIHTMYNAGVGARDIRKHLILNSIEQKGYHQKLNLEWNHAIIYRILHDEDFTGVATWNFNDGKSISIEIPAIISRELWVRNQARLERNKILSTRNAGHFWDGGKAVYLLQGILRCGDCGKVMRIHSDYWYYHNGNRYARKRVCYRYYCESAHVYPDKPHPKPYTRGGIGLDWQVWRHLVDNGIKNPDVITTYILDRQTELQTQGKSVDGDIAHTRRKLVEVDSERAFYQRQAGRGKMTEQEFDIRMEETEDIRQHWQSELESLKELRDDQSKVKAGVDYVNNLMANIQTRLSAADVPPDELRKLPREKQIEILKIRQDIIRALVRKVTVWADGQVKIEGVLDGSEAAQFELGSP